jgi:hypothetical protein
MPTRTIEIEMPDGIFKTRTATTADYRVLTEFIDNMNQAVKNELPFLGEHNSWQLKPAHPNNPKL